MSNVVALYTVAVSIALLEMCILIAIMIPGEDRFKEVCRKYSAICIWSFPVMFYAPLIQAVAREIDYKDPMIARPLDWAVWGAMVIATSGYSWYQWNKKGIDEL